MKRPTFRTLFVIGKWAGYAYLLMYAVSLFLFLSIWDWAGALGSVLLGGFCYLWVLVFKAAIVFYDTDESESLRRHPIGRGTEGGGPGEL